ncbi:hypothetical protein [Thalassobaculum salexigens]|uniref:hypothetical protein n=1 Tax=Thalassobaculum salexigens TaxID=455360 RepID=UPI00048D7BFA|nr:hypothetical protein [Thalassobaculum salexigens]
MKIEAEGIGLDPVKLLVETGLLTAYFGAVIFVVGWSYADRFFAELGLSFAAIDGIETKLFWAYAYWVFRDAWLLLLIAGFVLLFAAAVAVAFSSRLMAQRRIVVAILGLLAAAGLLGSGYLGALRASQQVPQLFAEGFHNFPRVVVIAKEDSELAGYLTDRGELGTSTCFRKVFMDRRNLYGYAGYKSLRDQRPNILILPLSDIAAIEIIRNPGLCEP